MIARVASVAGMLALGAVVCAGLYWVFVNTPEANVLTLTVSALLAIAVVMAAAVAINTAVLFARGASVKPAFGRAVRGVFWFALAIVPLAVAWWAIGRADAWVEAHSGEINAWFIVRFGWADITPLLTAETWISRWLRWAVFPVLSLSLLATLLTNEAGTGGAAFLRRAWHWRTLAVVTLVFVLLFALPWQLTNWRPALPPTWVEPTVAAMRVGTAFVLAVAGGAIMIVVSTRERGLND